MDIQSIRQLLSQGDTGKALMALIALLEKDSRYKDSILRTLRVAEANFNAVRQQEQRGILSFQEAQREYSRVNDVLVSALDDIEAGRVPAAAAPPARRNPLVLLAGGFILLAAVAFGVWKFRHKTNECPPFTQKSNLHVLILPFDNLGGMKARPGLVIQDSIRNLTQKVNIPAEVILSTKDKGNEDEAFSEQAEALLKSCDVDLVIFGKYKAFSGDSIRVRMGFRFKTGGNSVNSPFQTYRDITAVQPTRDLQDAIFSLCAMLAVRNRNLPAAKRWMAKIQEKDAMDEKMANWLAAQPGG